MPALTPLRRPYHKLRKGPEQAVSHLHFPAGSTASCPMPACRPSRAERSALAR